jgi:hypothetical protein
MTGTEAINALALLGVRIYLAAGDELRAGPRHALTDQARRIIVENREPIAWALAGFPEARSWPGTEEAPEDRPRPDDAAGTVRAATAGNSRCAGCARLRMREEPRERTRRRWWWTCSEGFAPLEIAQLGGLVLAAPPECDRFEPWQPGAM